ncbi:MAG: SOS response-associated peptidase [Thermodesulfobacteriota bacterium]
MCGRFFVTAPGSIIAERFQLAVEPELPPRFNIAPSQAVLAVRTHRDSGGREPAMLKWGLIPRWAKEISHGYKTINARAETVEKTPAFRDAFRRRRCLVVATGFYEWQKRETSKQPYAITMADGSPFAFAGLWELRQAPGEDIMETCAIITTEANGLVARIHDRMPVILPEGAYDLWLDPSESRIEVLKPLLRPYPQEAMAAYAVSKVVNNPANETPECLAPAPE